MLLLLHDMYMIVRFSTSNFIYEISMNSPRANLNAIYRLIIIIIYAAVEFGRIDDHDHEEYYSINLQLLQIDTQFDACTVQLHLLAMEM